MISSRGVGEWLGSQAIMLTDSRSVWIVSETGARFELVLPSYSYVWDLGWMEAGACWALVGDPTEANLVLRWTDSDSSFEPCVVHRGAAGEQIQCFGACLSVADLDRREVVLVDPSPGVEPRRFPVLHAALDLFDGVVSPPGSALVWSFDGDLLRVDEAGTELQRVRTDLSGIPSLVVELPGEDTMVIAWRSPAWRVSLLDGAKRPWPLPVLAMSDTLELFEFDGELRGACLGGDGFVRVFRYRDGEPEVLLTVGGGEAFASRMTPEFVSIAISPSAARERAPVPDDVVSELRFETVQIDW